MILRREGNVDVEKDILIGMIVSGEYLRKIRKQVQLKYFQLDFVKKIAGWVLDYFDTYGEAPVQHIENIYNTHSMALKPEERELMSKFLESLSHRYENSEHFNVQYLIDNTNPYFTSRLVTLTNDEVSALLQAGKSTEAELVIENYKGIQKDLVSWYYITSEEVAREIYRTQLSPEVDSTDTLFTMPGVFGQLVGPLKRGWLVSLLAPRKRGKTWFLQEFAQQASMSKLNVLFISLEMNYLGLGSRMLTSIVSMGPEPYYDTPVFDCMNNQTGRCRRSQRVTRTNLMQDGALITIFDPTINYIPCTACRKGCRSSNPEDYQAAIWFERVTRSIPTENKFIKYINAYHKANGRIVVRPYPAFSANVTDIKGILGELEFVDGFVPDVIVIDYADIIRPESSSGDAMSQNNETWKMLKNLAETKQCLVLTATQANRSADESKHVKSTQVSWDIRKNDHVDAQFALSQLPEEKKSGIMRVSNTLHRWKEAPDDQVYVLQSLALGQVLVDSEWCPTVKTE
jgi:DNA-dependent RNA polymerase auxiliary subunit epsilon